MRRWTPTTFTLGFLCFTLVGALACKQEDPTVAAKDYPAAMAEGFCKAVYSCSCEDYPYTDLNECLAELTTAYDQASDAAFLANLSYDGSCPADALANLEDLACKASQPALPGGVCIPPCYAWHGPLPAGSQCEVVASSAEAGVAFSTCAQGLTCAANICVNPCQAAPLPGLGQPCPDFVCAAGGMCDVDTQICVAMPDLPGPGEACLDGLCDPTNSVCVAEVNVCGALPGLGQDCLNGLCSTETYCGADDVCLARPALACGLLVGEVPGDGDGDGDPTTGDGDGDPTTGDGDGDGDPTTGDGDGDPTTGDGDGDLCGDGIIQAGELCDGSNLGGTTCIDLGYVGGALACNSSCTFDPSGCTNTPVDQCGWDPSNLYYECGFAGEDPDGVNPIECPPGLVDGGACGRLTGEGCCDANGNNWYCSDDGQGGTAVVFSSCG